MTNYQKATKLDYQRINEYFTETGWVIEESTEILVFENCEEVAEYLGFSHGYNKDPEEVDTFVENQRNVWFDGEGTCNYYVIVE